MSGQVFIARQDTLENDILPAHWLSHYKLFGEESYTYQNKEIWKKLCMSSAAANDRDMHGEALEAMLTTFSTEHIGKWMLLIYGLDATALEGLATMAAVTANGTAMAAVAGNALLMHAIIGSKTARTAITGNTTAMGQILANETAAAAMIADSAWMKEIAASATAMGKVAASAFAMEQIAASGTAMNSILASKIAIGKVAASATAMGKIAASETAMEKIAVNETAMSAVAANATARNKVLASAYYDTCIKTNEMAMAKLIVGTAGVSAAAYSSYAEIAASETAMGKIIASENAMELLTATGGAMAAVTVSLPALKTIAAAYTNTTAMLLFLKAVNLGSTYVKNMYNTLTAATETFTAVQLGYKRNANISGADSWATAAAAPNAFLALSCGYNSDSTAGVNVLYNGDTLLSGKGGISTPQSVSSSNVNAITMAPSTFENNGGGYLAVQKFTAQ